MIPNNCSEWTPEEVKILQASSHLDPASIAELLPLRTKDAVRFKLASLKKKSKPKVKTVEEIVQRERTIGKNSGSVDVSGLTTEVKTLEDLVKVCEIDLQFWEVERWSCKAYGGFLKDADKKPVKVQLFSVSAKLIRKKSDAVQVDVLNLIQELKDTAAPLPEVWRPAYPFKVADSRRLLELSIPDLHIGKLAWAEECGEDYDSDIARNLFADAVNDLLAKTAGHVFDEILLVVGNDFLNTDNSQNTTTAGTPQDCDTRHAKTFRIARQLITETVKRLREFAPKIVVLFVPGNHDTQSNFFLGEVIDAVFFQCVDVVVDNRPTLRKYFKFGKVLLGFTHGDKEKAAELPMLMAIEQPELWGLTLHREIHTGHFHQKKATSWVGLSENKGVTVRILPSLCAPEDWHVGKGYVGNTRSAEAYVWDSEEGLVGTAIYNAPIQRAA